MAKRKKLKKEHNMSISIRIPSKLFKDIDQTSKKLKRKRSEIIRRALGNYIPSKRGDGKMDMWDFGDDFFDWRRFRQQMDKLMKSSFGKMQPDADISETKDEMVIEMDMPGMNKKDVEVFASPDSIEVKAAKKQETEERDKHFYKKERSSKAYHRVIPMPVRIDPKKVYVEYKDGVLKVKVKKKEKSKRVKLKVK